MKRKGTTFDHAWRLALQRIAWPHDKQSRHEWKRVLADLEPVWRDCYENVGSPVDVERLVAALAGEADDEALLAA